MVAPTWGEIWLGEEPDKGPRPYLVLTRPAAIPVLSAVLVAPVTRSIRQIPTELPLGKEEGLRDTCVATMDNITVVPKRVLTRRLGAIASVRRREVCSAVAAAIDC